MRPKLYPKERVQMQVRLPAALRKRLERESARRMVSMTVLVENAITEALDRWEQEQLVTN